jgi:2-polyprenyl-3-methyl-5-hydroxy-6-metoxy-1,4-benzoquinol methylase
MQSYVDKTDGYFAFARKEIDQLLPPQCGRVLEVGCGSGATLGWLRQTKRSSHTVGIEIFEAAALSARAHVDEVSCLDFEKEDLPDGHGRFNLVLCLDVLEHMVNPWAVVDRLVVDYLAPGGTLIVSLPNVRHYSVAIPLLFQGRWEYQGAGLLDRTHLRFFTRDTALRLVSHMDLEAVHCVGSGFEWGTRKSIFNALTVGFFKDLLTYQYLLCARKKPE